MVQWSKVVLYYLWIAPHTLLLVVAAIMFQRRLYRKFPVFFAYTIYETIEFLLLFLAYISGASLGSPVYRYIYVPTLLGSAALRFGIIQEIFNNVFHGYSRLTAIATISTRWVTGLLVVAAVCLVLYSSASAPDNLMVGVRLLERSVNIIQVGLLLFLFLFSRLFGLSWRSYTFGIAFGFALLASAQIIAWTLALTSPSENTKDLLDFLPTGGYHVCVLVWIGYLLTAEKTVRPPAYHLPDIDRWTKELEQPQ